MEEIILRPGSKELLEVQRLYEEAFPEDEQIPFDRLVNNRKECILRAYSLEGELCALSYVFEYGTIVYIGYLAVLKDLRGKQIGTQLLEHLKEQYRNYQIVGEIELAEEGFDPTGIKRRRREFYLRHGFHSAGLCYRLFNTDYEILTDKGVVTKEIWNRLAEAHVGAHIAKRIEYI